MNVRPKSCEKQKFQHNIREANIKFGKIQMKGRSKRLNRTKIHQFQCVSTKRHEDKKNETDF